MGPRFGQVLGLKTDFAFRRRAVRGSKTESRARDVADEPAGPSFSVLGPAPCTRRQASEVRHVPDRVVRLVVPVRDRPVDPVDAASPARRPVAAAQHRREAVALGPLIRSQEPPVDDAGPLPADLAAEEPRVSRVTFWHGIPPSPREDPGGSLASQNENARARMPESPPSTSGKRASAQTLRCRLSGDHIPASRREAPWVSVPGCRTRHEAGPS